MEILEVVDSEDDLSCLGLLTVIFLILHSRSPKNSYRCVNRSNNFRIYSCQILDMGQILGLILSGCSFMCGPNHLNLVIC